PDAAFYAPFRTLCDSPYWLAQAAATLQPEHAALMMLYLPPEHIDRLMEAGFLNMVPPATADALARGLGRRVPDDPLAMLDLFSPADHLWLAANPHFLASLSLQGLATMDARYR